MSQTTSALNQPGSKPASRQQVYQQRLDQLSVPMILLSLVWLVLFSTVLPHSGEDSLQKLRLPFVQVCGSLCVLIWLVFIAEFFLNYRASKGMPNANARYRRMLLVLFIPGFRLSLRKYSSPNEIWIPFMGWEPRGKHLRKRLARAFSGPMVLVVLLVLPIMAIEHYRGSWLVASPKAKFAVDIGSQFIWLAFAYEFIVMISASFKRGKYIKKHFLDLLIILLPIILFILPFLNFLPILRLSRLGRLAKLTKMMRMKRVGLKAVQFLVILAGAKRIGKNWHSKQIQKLRGRIEEREEELDELRCELSLLENELQEAKQKSKTSQEA